MQNLRRNWLCFGKRQEFGEFWPNTRKSQNLHSNGLLLTKVYNAWAKKLRRSYVSWHWRGIQYLKKNWLVVWKMTSGICASSWKSENLHFIRVVLSKAYKVLDEKVQKSYVSWHWRVIQIKGNSWEICFFCVMQ